MVRKLPIIAAIGLAFALGACASSSSDKVASASSKAKSEQSWWKPSTWSRKADFKPWVYGDVRQGKGLLGKDKDGFVLYQEKQGGSSDPSKPTKVRR